MASRKAMKAAIETSRNSARLAAMCSKNAGVIAEITGGQAMIEKDYGRPLPKGGEKGKRKPGSLQKDKSGSRAGRKKVVLAKVFPFVVIIIIILAVIKLAV